jgi:outer membrane receptor for ferrienterochelin and colicins
MGRLFQFLIFILAISNISSAQSTWSDLDSMLFAETQEIVVTATRTERPLNNIAVPTLLINSRTIQLSGNLRLSDLLQEQTGLFLTSGSGSSAIGGGVFGNGIQIQGLSPDYTLIMLDSEPLTGRQGGVIDLSRFSVGNIKKVEVIKGPSSALYGSEAMGGVVNIITDQNRKNFFNGSVRYGSFNNFDINGSTNYNTKKSTLFLYANHNRSDGYDLDPSTQEKTVDPFNNSTYQLKLTHRFTPKTRLVWNNRIFTGLQTSLFALGSNTLNVDGSGKTTDININPVVNHIFNDELKTSFRLYGSFYRYDQNLTFLNSNELYYEDDFNHNFYRLENQTDWEWAKDQHLTIGGGYNVQTVETIRYRTQKTQQLSYGFIQNEWKVKDNFTIIPGLRYDINSDFSNRLTPKLSAQYKLSPQLNVNFSFGSGFKAPDFRQLYLYYVNPAGQGYRIYGAAEFSLEEIRKQQQEGLVVRILPEAEDITQLRPEMSSGINSGFTYTFKELPVKIETNLFYNNVTDMINYLPIAIQSNGAFIFSYKNINKSYTSGAEINAMGTTLKNLNWSLGYQFLKSGDRAVLNNFKNGKVFGRDEPLGSARVIERSEYTGLLGRSQHMANAKLSYENPLSDWAGTIRAIYRSKWGVVDLDGNGFANMTEEYAKGFTQLNLSVQKKISKTFTAHLNINNALNHIDPINLSHLSGRSYLMSLSWNLSY